MWLTSKSPARCRTAKCSFMMPEYSTGISQPPNSTMRAPAALCAELSAVRFKLMPGEVDNLSLKVMRGINLALSKVNVTYKKREGQGNVFCHGARH